jgi:hypothetical protein
MKKPTLKQRMKARPPRTDREAYGRLLAFSWYGYKKAEIARIIGVSKQAITRWDRVPINYVTRLSEGTGIPKAFLRPSDFA